MGDNSKRSNGVEPKDNPYLAHIYGNNNQQQGNRGKNPLDGWMPRKVNAKQVLEAMVSAFILVLWS
jgi:hypothetical protein